MRVVLSGPSSVVEREKTLEDNGRRCSSATELTFRKSTMRRPWPSSHGSVEQVNASSMSTAAGVWKAP